MLSRLSDFKAQQHIPPFTQIHTETQTNTHTHTNTHIHTSIHPFKYPYSHIHTQTRTHTPTPIHTHIHSETHTCTHTHTHTHVFVNITILYEVCCKIWDTVMCFSFLLCIKFIHFSIFILNITKFCIRLRFFLYLFIYHINLVFNLKGNRTKHSIWCDNASCSTISQLNF